MSDRSTIEWTDATWTPVRGCEKVSPGCKHCYAETFAERFRGVPGHPFEQGFEPILVPGKLFEPLRWATPRKVFVNSMSDLFQRSVPDAYIRQVADVMLQADRHTYQVLTKRADRMADLMSYVVAVSRISLTIMPRDDASFIVLAIGRTDSPTHHQPRFWHCPAHAQWAPEPITEGFAAIGDAAYAHEPIAGQGVRCAISLACVLAGVIDAELREPLAETRSLYREPVQGARARHLANLPVSAFEK